MPGLTVLIAVCIVFATAPPHLPGSAGPPSQTPRTRQLLAVRGEVAKVTAQPSGTLLITVKPAKEFGEVIVLARENDLVGQATGRSGDTDLIGLLAGDSREDETITAAELEEGDVVSVIYDPQQQNRVLEIYMH